MLTLAGIKVIPIDRLRAVKNGGEDAASLLAEYREDVANISAYVTAVGQIDFSFTNTPPDWYTEDFKNKLAICKADSYRWNRTILSELLELPRTIIEYDKVYQYNAEQIMLCISQWRKDPNQIFIDSIISNLNALQKGVANNKNLTDGVITMLSDYRTQLATDLTFFQDAKQKATNSKNVRANDLKQYEDDIRAMQEEIKRQQNIILGTGISGTAGLMACPVLVACGPVGLVIGIVCLLGGIGLLVAAICASKKVENLKKSIAEKNEAMNKATKDVAELSALCTSLEQLLSLADIAIESISGIASLWSQLSENLDGVINSAKKGAEHAAEKLMDDLEKDINGSATEWAKIVEKAILYSQLNIEVSKKVVEAKTA